MKQFTLIFLLLNIYLLTPTNAQWYPVNSNTSEDLNDIYFVSENTGYCAGNNGIILKTNDGGENWETVFQDSSIIGFYYVTTAFGQVIAFGGNPDGWYKYVSVDNGENWVAEGFNYDPEDIQTYQNTLYFIDRNDHNLKKITEEGVTTIAEEVKLYGVNENEIVYTDYQHIFKSEDEGIIWYQLPDFPEIDPNQWTYAKIKSFSDTIIIKATYPGMVFYSLDNGQNWLEGNEIDGSLVFNIVSPFAIYGAHPMAGISVTQDLGNSWQEQLELENNWFIKGYFFNDELGFFIGENGIIYKTTNGGGLNTAEQQNTGKVKVVPNPAKGQINLISTENLSVIKIQLYDSSGKLIKTYPKEMKILDIHDIQTGQYVLKLTTKETVISKKILKTR